MQSSQNKTNKEKKKIGTIKLISAFLIMCFFFSGLSFAQDAGIQKVDNLAQITHFLVSFLSRGRALLAILAGKLMSNDLIYGSFMNLDIFLWKVRNIMKNFANYALGFLFLYMIIKSIISKEGASDIIKNKLGGFVIAGILIQASWFLIAVVVDISTIAVTAIGAIPGQMIQSDMGLQSNLAYLNAGGGASLAKTGEIWTGLLMTFDPNKKLTKEEQFITTEQVRLTKPLTQENYLDMILPSYNTISGPLLFFGTSIFQFQDYSISNPQTTKSWKRLIEFGLNLLIIIIYSLAMIALVLINFFRIFFLRIIIMFSPFIVLITVFDKMGIIKIKTDKMKLLGSISIENTAKLIFKPVIFMAYISIMMIFVIGMRALLIPMDGSDVKLNDEITMKSQEIVDPVAGKSYNSSIQSDGIFHFTVNGAKNSIAELIVYFFTIFLLWFLLKAAVSKGSGMSFVDKKLEDMAKSTENIAGQLPIVPIAGGVGVSSVFGNGGFVDKVQSKIEGTMNQKNIKKLKEAYPELYKDYGTNYSLENAAKDSNAEKFWTKAQSFAKGQGGITYESSSEFRSGLSTRFNTHKKNASTLTDRERKDDSNDINSIEKFIDKNYDKIHEKMGGDSQDAPTDGPTFKKKPYGSKQP